MVGVVDDFVSEAELNESPVAFNEEVFNPPLELPDADFQLTPLGWVIYGSEHGWYCRTGNYGATVEALIQAGAKLPEQTGGTSVVREVLG